MRNHGKANAFSLVEVVLSLAVVVFAGFAIIGLLGLGLRGNHDSNLQLQAATIAEYLCSTRRAATTNDFTASGSTQPGFPLPALNSSTNNLSAATPTYLTWDGQKTTVANARFALLYSITPTIYSVPSGNATKGFSTVYLCLYWPPQGAAGSNSGHFEMTTTFALP